MINDKEINDVISKYPNLKYDNQRNLLIGNLYINHTYCDEHIIALYRVEIRLHINYPEELPVVFNIGKIVPSRFGHIYSDGSLCLATDVDQKLFFVEGNSLVQWIDSYVIPYYFAVEYFKKYNVYPFGDRSHGAKGKLEYYSELFHVKNLKVTLNILEYIAIKNYRGHAYCPCGSGKKLRNCHKNQVIKWKQDKYQKLFLKDYESIIKELNRREDA
ncbi:SEC-C domain-containing protein [Clostridium oryzae]|uniref:SEC-C motif protein n=1 Tax=Clostridium oryzae TaxID=1450648 RepID=A0A1V4I7V9_9CLOT|nr:SEC-C domain-containing protein [Clostridium oryzae]OPJ55705.1 hypothetical protein CLORY_43760 [Clostridium oryzae]